MLRRLSLALVAASACGSTQAMDDNGNYAIWGFGNKSCNAYASSRAADEALEFRHYIMGYLTAYNTLSPNTPNITGRKTLPELAEWLDDYCEQNPMDSFDRALKMLVTDVEPSRTVKTGSGWGRAPKQESGNVTDFMPQSAP